ncbi:hypothetical protein HYALB_00005319 [Hymenoscyphus albidus]|uniref:threonine--tRNA ligase n=1 Tax=Hymenoscyphus albidus TaxID=595503 RepID=A0A9N9Q1D4_9HELO|nr:hypothetical protein HYALB_00005319 [Hymenoscyphus albidus]
MQSSKALALLRPTSRRQTSIFRVPIQQLGLKQGYCSVCDAQQSASPPIVVKASKNLPTPQADHRELGVQQELFTLSKYSPGSTIFLPNGTKIFNNLTNFLRSQYEYYGFQEVISPTIYKKSLWEKSGHWENYAEDMYSVTGRGAEGKKTQNIGEDEEYGLKPMNCPGHCLIFASKQRSYRDLPVRYADFSPLHRNEISGALSGLTRGRRFHQDDGHIFCRPSQIREEISKTLEFVRLAYDVLGLGSYRLALSTRPREHFIGTVEEWSNAEAALKESLDASGEPWTLNEGDGAFYGPKIDIILKDTDGKEHQTATIQLDFQLPKRFELSYHAPAPELEQKGLSTTDAELLSVEGPVTPVMIHRAVLGSVERSMALLIEHYNGAWPYWLNPRQMMLVTVNDQEPVVEYAREVKRILQGLDEPKGATSSWKGTTKHSNGQSVDIDDSARSVKKKLSEAKRSKYAIVIVIGQKDVESGTVRVDFSSIPSYRFNIATNPVLLSILGKDSQAGNELTQDEIKNITMKPKDLKVVLEHLRASHV